MITAKALVPAKTAEAYNNTQYTSTNVTTIIDKFTATNYSVVAATITVNLIPNGSSVGDSNVITKTRALQPNEVYTFPELVGQILEPGGAISTNAGTASSINIRVSGREIT